jgi:hypothetical protein
MPHPTSLRYLLDHAVDYAGLFPPAALPMADVVANFAAYRRDPDAWALGRLVVPAARIGAFAAELDRANPSTTTPWQLIITLGAAYDTECRMVRSALAREGRAIADAFEAKAETSAEVDRLMEAVGDGAVVFIEVPLDPDPEPLLRLIQARGGFAKIRMGGVTREAFPSPEPVLRFLAAVTRLGLGFKATAGLHHPFRAVYRLTYEPNAAEGPMYGFLNLLVAAALLREGLPLDTARAALLEEDRAVFQAAEETLSWRDHRLDLARLQSLRTAFHGFGSCSFREPVDELPISSPSIHS